MKKKRTDSIVAVTVVKRATMYVEADTPEEAYKYAKEYCNDVPESAFDYSDISVESWDAYTTHAAHYMDEIWVEDGETMSFDDYVDELEEQEEGV